VLDQTKVKPHPPLPIPNTGVVLAHPANPIPMAPPIDIQIPPTGPTAITPDVSGGPTVLGPAVYTTLPLRPLSATHTIPPYPSIAIRLAHEGTAQLRITVDELGNAATAEIARSSGHEELDAAAIAWVKAHWRYQPAMKDGHAVAANTTANVTFRLDQAH
jgi:protein TonB